MPANQTQDLWFNVTGQVFEFFAPSRAASITDVQVFAWSTGDDGTEQTATTGSGSIDSVNTTFDATSGLGATDTSLCSLTATTNIVKGRQYLATNSEGETEWVDVVEISAGVSVSARTRMQNVYASTDTFEGTRLTIAVLDAWIQESGSISDGVDPNPGYRVRWTWVDADSATHVDYTGTDVVRYRGADHGVTPADMEQFHPLWSSMLPSGHLEDVGARIIDAGFQKLEDDLLALDLPDQQVRNKDALQRMVKYAAVRQLHYARYLAGGDLEKFEVADREYQGPLDKWFKVETKVALGTGSSGAGTRTSVAGVWRR